VVNLTLTGSKLKRNLNAYGLTSKNMEQATKDSYDNEAAFLGTTSEQVKLKRNRMKSDKKLYNTL
jgi:hypothetical protein